MRALIVAAVSTEAQATENHYSLEQQIANCRSACEARGWQVAEEISIAGHSRNYNWLDEIMADCPKYADMIRAIRDRRIDLIVVQDYDRLWRTDALRAQVMALCRENRVQVFSLNQPIEPTDPSLLEQAASDSNLILEAISGVISEAENRTRTRRMIAGKRARVTKRGLPCFSNTIPYGYERDSEGRIVINPVQAEIVRWMFERRAYDRWGYNHIARTLTERGVPPPGVRPGSPTPSRTKVWHDSAVRNMLHNPFYIGHVRWGSAYSTKGQHEAIISVELWHRAQQIDRLRQRIRQRSAIRGHRLLTGLIRCGFCGHAMSYVPTPGGHLAMRCSYYMKMHGRDCQPNWMRAEPVEDFVMRSVRKALRDPDAHLETIRDQYARRLDADEQQRLQAALEELEVRWARWDHAFEVGAISLDELLRHRQRIQREQERIRARLRQWEEDTIALKNAEKQLRALAYLVDDLPDLPLVELRDVYRRLIARIFLKRKQTPEIEWL